MHPSADRPEDGLRADRLTPTQKRQVWAHIRANEPTLHAFLVSPEFVAIRDLLNARYQDCCSPVIPWRTLRAVLDDDALAELGDPDFAAPQQPAYRHNTRFRR